MRALRVALVVKAGAANVKRDGRQMGAWSYPVPQFTWTHHSFGKGHRTDRRHVAAHADVIVHEDGGNWGEWTGSGGPPVVYVSIDDTLSPRHLAERVGQARQADLVLVEQGPLDAYRDRRGGAAERLPYCANDLVFRSAPARTLDVAYHCTIGTPGAADRRTVSDGLLGWAAPGDGRTLSTGPLGLPDYAAALGRARVAVNWSRVPDNRPHRLIDTLSAGAALLTGPYGTYPGDDLVGGLHLLCVRRPDEVADAVEQLLDSGLWLTLAAEGHRLVAARHTWATRAAELRALLAERLGL
jgi:glycosyltransferase involved in cell wall biosynthesis